MKPKSGYSSGKSRKMSQTTARGIAKAKSSPATNREIQEKAAKLIAPKPGPKKPKK